MRLSPFVIALLLVGCAPDREREKQPSAEVGPVVVLADSNFDREVLQSSQPVLVDFWAGWCTACLEMKPVIRQLAEEYAGRAKFGQLNVEENQFAAAKYKVDSLPALLVFRDGEVVERFDSLRTKDQLAGVLESVVMHAKNNRPGQE